MQFRDTAPEVREVLATAVWLIRWRGRIMQTAAAFVRGVDTRNQHGVPMAAKRIAAVSEAVNRGHGSRVRKLAAAGMVARQGSPSPERGASQ